MARQLEIAVALPQARPNNSMQRTALRTAADAERLDCRVEIRI
jgi:hypothetical protein